MQLENMPSKEPIIHDFFSWIYEDKRITDKNIVLKKEPDVTLENNYKDANIYYPPVISELLETTAFRRLGRIGHLSSVIHTYPSAFHNRLEHSKGVYYRKLEEFLYNFEEPSWKDYIEQNNLRIYILAELIKMLGHDIGHPMQSHAIEQQIFENHGAHEIIGQRIMLENPEINSILSKLSPELPNIMQELYNKKILNFESHDESNYDVDRLDYLTRDNLYLGNPVHFPYQKYETVLSEKGIIDVYPYSSLKHIEDFLEIREHNYQSFYWSVTGALHDTLHKYVIKALLMNPDECGQELMQFLSRLKDTDLSELDLNEYLKWDDIRFFDNMISIAQNHPNNNIRELATMAIPNIDSFLNLIYSHLKVSTSHTFTDDDKDFLRKVKKVIAGNDDFSKNSRNKNYSSDNILVSGDKPFSSKIGDKKTITVKVYDKSEPLYIRSKDGQIYELSEHPERKRAWDKAFSTTIVNFAFVPYLRLNGMTDEDIKRTYADFKTLTECKTIRLAHSVPDYIPNGTVENTISTLNLDDNVR